MPRAIFQGLVIALAGRIEANNFSPENVKRWTNLRKGSFADTFDESVTHLLCTQEHFDQRVAAGKIIPL